MSKNVSNPYRNRGLYTGIDDCRGRPINVGSIIARCWAWYSVGNSNTDGPRPNGWRLHRVGQANNGQYISGHSWNELDQGKHVALTEEECAGFPIDECDGPNVYHREVSFRDDGSLYYPTLEEFHGEKGAKAIRESNRELERSILFGT